MNAAKPSDPDHHFVRRFGRADRLARVLVEEHIHGHIGRSYLAGRVIRITLVVRPLQVNLQRRQIRQSQWKKLGVEVGVGVGMHRVRRLLPCPCRRESRGIALVATGAVSNLLNKSACVRRLVATESTHGHALRSRAISTPLVRKYCAHQSLAALRLQGLQRLLTAIFTTSNRIVLVLIAQLLRVCEGDY